MSAPLVVAWTDLSVRVCGGEDELQERLGLGGIYHSF